MPSFTINEARPSDLDAILDIEGRSFPTPWPRESFEQELSLPFAGLFVLRGGDEQVWGYASIWVVDTEIHLLTLAVEEGRRREGLGRALLSHVEETGIHRGGRYLFLEVRRSNEGAIVLYRNSGYTQVGVRKSYYSDNGEDAIVMLKVLSPPSHGEEP